MARTLPWLREGPKATTRLSRAQPAKVQRSIESASEDDALPPTTGVSTPRRKLPARAARTPSSSLPPQPPSEELMLDGLSRDDIYIMVEDEFLAVAKQFTQHLHHAEYKRLKDLAKTRNASAITTISRPTDSISVMREETKRRKQNETKVAKQKVALEQIKGPAAARRPRTASDESDVEVVRDDDPWVGTTLQGLMTSPSKSHASLTGLQGVSSSTRAAAGYTKPQREVEQVRPFDPDRQTTMHKSIPQGKTSRQKVPEPSESESDATLTVDDDDLEAPAASRRPPHKKVTISAARPFTISTTIKPHRHPRPSSPSPPPCEPTRRPIHSSPTHKSILKRKNVTPSLNILDDLLPQPTPQSEVSKRMMKRRADLNAKKDSRGMEMKKPESVNEIPIFLV